MRGGSDDTRTPGDAPNAVDDGWDALIGEAEEEHGDSSQDAALPVTEDHAVAPDEERQTADDEMARLMAGAAPKLPVVSTEPSAPIDLHEPAAVPTPAHAPTPTAVPDAAPIEAPIPVKPKVVVRSELVSTKERRSSGSLRVVGTPVGIGSADKPVRAARPTEAAVPPPPASSAGLPWLWIGAGATVAIAAVVYMAMPVEPKPRATPKAADEKRTPVEPLPAEVASTTAEVDGTGGSGEDDTAGAGEGDAEPTAGKPPKPRSADPREPPPGTPPEIAAVFRRLPIGPADRAPVGGIGASGIHIDHIAMGTETQGATCRGRDDDFSVSAGDRAGVCVRVVHPRDKEELQVLWEKKGGSTRRSKMVVLPLHAYRTRGYLVLRNEYIGDWTVHILSADGVELASHDFEVVP